MAAKSSFLSAMGAALVLTGSGFVSVGAAAHEARAEQDQQRTEQGEARREMKAANQLTLREIERRILPKMQGSEYLGMSNFDRATNSYRLKFIKDGRVTYLDVDARTGRVVRRSR
ncbi:MAG: hypothetical protein AAGK17_07585 [Pseudomonadota bacterium]